jgi:hypothetical protein
MMPLQAKTWRNGSEGEELLWRKPERGKEDIQAARAKWEEHVFDARYPSGEETNRLQDIDLHYTDFLANFAVAEREPKQYIDSLRSAEVDTRLFKLPPVTVKPFAGKLEDYLGFRQSFMSLVGNAKLMDHQKLHHLRSSLRGEALEAIAAVGVDDAGYEAAWTVLNSRYGYVQTIKGQIMGLIMKNGGPPRDNKPTTIRAKHDEVRSLYTKLIEIDPALKAQDEALRPLVERYYTHVVRKEIEKDLGQTPPVEAFLAQAETIISRDCRIRAPNPFDRLGGPSPQPEEFRPRHKQMGGSTGAFALSFNQKTGYGQGGGSASNSGSYSGAKSKQAGNSGAFYKSGKNPGGNKPPGSGGSGAPGGGSGGGPPRTGESKGSGKMCHFCNKPGHYITFCEGFKKLTVPKREAFVREKKLCFRCLREHLAPDCFFTRPCPVMDGGVQCNRIGHHGLLHRMRTKPQN